MHVLIWCPPWAGQGGDIFFGLNSFAKHLLIQAELLQSRGWSVTVSCPSAYQTHLNHSLDGINVIEMDSLASIKVIGSWEDPAPHLYRDPEAFGLSDRIAKWLSPQLPPKVDVVLVWEAPVPYLRTIYPDATIISQMPGALARAPYPQTTVFDPVGLYRDGVQYKAASEILAKQSPSSLAQSVSAKSREIFGRLPYSSRRALLAKGGRDKLTLLPLQISDHYAFKVDTGFSSQAEFCLEAIDTISPQSAIVVTEYVSRLYRDQIMSPEFTSLLQERRPDLVYDPSTSKVPSVSQHLLQFADEIATATSGLGLQAMMWDIPLVVFGNTHLRPFDHASVDTAEKRQRVLSFALNKHQPLNEAITSDGRFLVHLIEEIHGRRDRPLLDRLPDLGTIDPDYADRVMRAFRGHEVTSSFVKLGLAQQEPSKATQFAELLAKKKPKLISFDLFDTLVKRGFEQPADLYRYIEQDLRSGGADVPFDFADKRLAAELMARANAKGDEISIDDIYKELASAEGLTEAEVTRFRDRELEIEASSCQNRPLGSALFDIAIQAMVPICVTSDMYLPRSTIDAIIERSGLTHVEYVYLSSEVSLTKKSGALFDHIAAHRGISASEIVHVGDNEKTDVIPAQLKGVTPFHVPRAVEYLWKHESFAPCFPKKRPPITSLGRSVTAAAIAGTLFDDPKNISMSISGGDPWKLGYATLGPLIYGFVTWLRTAALEHDTQVLHFLSREGKILKDVFDRIELESPSGIRSSYLWGSRRAIRVAQMQTLADIIELGKQTVDQTATLGSLLANRFGLQLQDIDGKKIRAAGYKSLGDKVHQSGPERTKLVHLLTSLQDDILSVSRAEGAVYRDYLKSKGLFADAAFAVVDVGWNANMQGSLGQLIGKPITGYYFATLAAAARWKPAGHRIHAYYLEECTMTENKPVLANRLMIENLLCDITPTVQSIERTADGSFRPKYAGKVLPHRVQLINAIQDGARSFADDVCRVLGRQSGTTEIRPDITLPLMERFLSNPKAEDAKLFEGHELEDAFSGLQRRFLLAPFERGRPQHPSYWRAGERALMEANQSLSKRPSTKTPSNAKLPTSPHWTHRPIMPFVRPFVRKLGNSDDVREFNADPSAFFAKLSNPRYRRIGAILFPIKR
ncbi:hypothetical protein [Neorhizobium petrolearium]|uniref:Uncharacterized protein n=1 Tax=Neorhizobium petrolearium TaxID=515361 RepID=A0ABY8M2S6_9HYPH|nr:hypothetical protein [Neorhizobium petrolearium]MCC2608400.1 hypothetical protein [Neorhizobium petrolearium]WGI68678.1 hypothetical protein QEO92_00830 [Neorhizobium petrolearium]